MYGLKYILAFHNELGELYELYFSFLGYAGAGSAGVQPIELTGITDAIILQSTAGDETKLSYILGTECLINLVITPDINLSLTDFIAEQDNEIQVTIYKDQVYDRFVFQGFIVVEDNSQPFLDKPYNLSLRALDGLGLLKGVDLTDTNDFLFAGNLSIMQWVAQILYKTGQTMNIRSYFNFYNEAFAPDVDPLTQIFLSSATFSQGDAFNAQQNDPSIDEAAISADDCYTALEKMMRCLRCRVFQEDGCFHIVNFYEYFKTEGMTYTEYAFDGIADGFVEIKPIARQLNKEFKTTVGKNAIIHPVEDDAILYLKLATKWVKLTFDYNQSQNKVCNQDLTDIGPSDRNPTFDETISSSIIDTTIKPVVNLTTQGYNAYCYTQANGNSPDAGNQNAYPANPATSTGFVRVVLDALNYTLQSFLTVPNPGSGKLTYMKTSQFLLDTSDVLQVTFSWRTKLPGTGANGVWGLAFVLLYGDDDTFWALRCFNNGQNSGDPCRWVQGDSNFHTNAGGGTEFVQSGLVPDTTQWTTVEANTQALPGVPFAAAPVSGRVEILLFYFNGSSDANAGAEWWFKDLNVTIVPFLQGTYNAKISGDYNFSGSNQNIKQTDSENVEISDSPKRYFKGALISANSDVLTPQWSRPGFTDNLRFTEAMERIMYNNLYRIIQKIEGTMRGLTYNDNDDISIVRPTGYLNTYTFVDTTTPDKKFILTSFEKHLDSGQGRHVFIEINKDANDTGFIAPDNFVFNYIFGS